VPDWASGKEYSDNLDAFIPAFSSTLQASLATILKGLVSSDDLEKIEEAVENTAKGAPHFEPVQGRLKFRPLPPKQPIRERKAVVRQKCEQAKRLCERQANEHPDDEGGRTWSILASLINSAKLNCIDPQEYLTDVLERIVSGRTKINQLHELLPWRRKAARQVTIGKRRPERREGPSVWRQRLGNLLRFAGVGKHFIADDAQRYFMKIGL